MQYLDLFTVPYLPRCCVLHFFTSTSQLFLGFSRLLERLRKINLNIIQMLNSHRNPNHVCRDPTPLLLRLGELLVRGGGRVNDQGLGVPDVGEVRGEDAAVDEGDASCVCVCSFER